MYDMPSTLDPELTRQVEPLLAKLDALDGLEAAARPGLALLPIHQPGTLVVFATRKGLLSLASFLLASAIDRDTDERRRRLEARCTEMSWPFDLRVVDEVSSVAPPASPRMRRLARGWALLMGALWISSIAFWAIGLYATVLWIGTRWIAG